MVLSSAVPLRFLAHSSERKHLSWVSAVQAMNPYHVRVLIPTYKETLEIVAKTVHAAYNAPLPYNCLRTIYVCDDGKDGSKRKWSAPAVQPSLNIVAAAIGSRSSYALSSQLIFAVSLAAAHSSRLSAPAVRPDCRRLLDGACCCALQHSKQGHVRRALRCSLAPGTLADFAALARRVEQMGPEIVYVSGRTRAQGEMNGKSANLNNCLSQIYPGDLSIPPNELVCIFDADQVLPLRRSEAPACHPGPAEQQAGKLSAPQVWRSSA